ncbi:MAG: PaaI family thioesterase [Candidatus Cloacimonadota bacterium]|nr:PaaI family thioesterase [Candidatus Cloacimonadota bacterium]
MKKLKNPYSDMDGHNCFGCADNNSCGLQMKFYEDEEKIFCIWDPKDHLQGYFNVLHGGVQATLMDEIASWVVFIKLETAGVTSQMQIKYLKPLYTNKGKIRIEARLNKMKKNIAIIRTEIYNNKSQLCSEAELYYFTFSREKAKKHLKYPGKEAFYE